MIALSSIELDFANFHGSPELPERLIGTASTIADMAGCLIYDTRGSIHTAAYTNAERHFRAAGKLRIMHIPIFRRAASTTAGLDGNFRLRWY